MNDDFEPVQQPEADSAPDCITKPTVEEPSKPKKSNRKIAVAVILFILAIVIFCAGFFVGMFAFRDRNPEPEETVLRTGQVAERVCPAVVLIQATSSTAVQSGTGFFIRSDGYLLTNYHVIQGAKTIRVTLYPGEVKKTARVVGYDENTDLALLYVKGSDFSTVTIGNSDLVAVGDQAIAIGHPSGEKCAWTVTQGIISAKRLFRQETGEETKMIQTDAPVNHGNSGGPLLNDRGEVIGVISKKLLDSDKETPLEGIGLAIPINEAMDAVKQWISE